MSWQSILVIAGFTALIPFFVLAAWVMDRFDQMDRDRP